MSLASTAFGMSRPIACPALRYRTFSGHAVSFESDAVPIPDITRIFSARSGVRGL